MINRYSYIIIFLYCQIISSISGQILELIQGGGYSHILCYEDIGDYLNINEGSINSQIMNCSKTRNMCIKSATYLCEIPCNFNKKQLFIHGTRYTINKLEKPKFNLTEKKYFNKENQNLTIKVSPNIPNVLSTNEIKISLSNNISCQNITIIINNNSIICQMNLSNIKFNNNEYLYINISLSYGLSCTSQLVGEIRIINRRYSYVFLIYLFLLLTILFIVSIVVVIHKKYKSRNKIRKFNSKSLLKMEEKFSNVQNKGFLEYQLTVQYSEIIGKLNPRFVLSFYDYMDQIFNVEFEKHLEDNKTSQVEDFKSILMNKEMLVNWIFKVEKTCRIKERCLVASFLTLYLFHNPKYFLDVMKTLLIKQIAYLKDTSSEKLLFSRSEFIIEKMIGFWITLCMYENLKTGEIGKRFYNLYRTIKSKLNTGLVDLFTGKAKYALSFDHLLLGDLDYKELSIFVNIKIQIRMNDFQTYPLEINMNQLRVNVISLDTISQVKEKILDEALIKFTNSEFINVDDNSKDLCIAPIDTKEYQLHFIKNNIQIQLEDYDKSSLTTTIDKECIIANTMKHYNIKNGTNFLLTNVSMHSEDSMFVVGKQSFYNTNKIEIHLQLPHCLNLPNHGQQKLHNLRSNKKLLFNPILEDIHRDSYIFMLLGTKKTLLPSIDSLFQCITNWKPVQNVVESSNKATKPNYCMELTGDILSNSINPGSDDHIKNNFYLKPVYYLFSMLDEIAESMAIDDNEIIQTWKNKSYFRQIWFNLLKNPNFIFPIEKNQTIYSCLNVVANIMLESSSMKFVSSPLDGELNFIKEMFLEDMIYKYSIWWQSFIESSMKVDESEIIDMISDVYQKHNLQKYQNSSIHSLQFLSKTLLIQNPLQNNEDFIWDFESLK